jgi:carbamoyltransferase
MIVLGFNCFHGDSSAALIHAAAEEERFRRIKHWASWSESWPICIISVWPWRNAYWP